MNIIKVLQNIVHKGTPHYKGSTVDADVHLQGADLESLAARGLIELNTTQNQEAVTPQPEAPEESEKPKAEEKVEELKTDVAAPEKPTDTQKEEEKEVQPEAPEEPTE